MSGNTSEARLRWPPVLRYLLGPGARQRNDRSACAEYNWSRFDCDLPSGLELQWLGTAGFRLSYEGHHLLIDPYATRPGLLKVLGGRRVSAAPEVIERHIPAASAVLVGHTHFDHALDIPFLATRYGCRVYGSPSLQKLLQLHGLAARATVVEFYKVYPIGPFEVTFVPSLHSRLILGLKIPFEGELTCDCLDDLNAGAYRCGQVYGIHIAVAGVRFYHQGSANLIEEAIRHRDVDYFLAGISGRGFTPGYTARMLRRLSPRVVIPHHHDNFFRGLDEPMGFSFNVNFGGFVEEVAAVSRDFEVRSLDLMQTVSSRG
jgi:L-ascorbate metabolism protein UlaG (beta-lactamase superfamily)